MRKFSVAGNYRYDLSHSDDLWKTNTRGSTLNAIQRAFDRAGVIFLDIGDTRNGGPGVRFKE